MSTKLVATEIHLRNIPRADARLIDELLDLCKSSLDGASCIMSLLCAAAMYIRATGASDERAMVGFKLILCNTFNKGEVKRDVGQS